MLPPQLTALEERRLLRPGGHAALWPLAADPRAVSTRAPAVVLVHGLGGRLGELQPLVDRLAPTGAQLYLLAWNSVGRRTVQSGRELADELLRLAEGPPGRDVLIVAHSLGGMVARVALNELAENRPQALARFARVRVVAIDTPWHGYVGPSDQGRERSLFEATRPFLPPGMQDLRARSSLFVGDPASPDPALRAGLYGVALPDHVGIEPCFAARGGLIADWTERPLASLPRKLVALFRRGQPVSGSARLLNFHRALVGSAAWPALAAELRSLAAAGRLDETAVRAALERHFPHLPGNHETVLRAHGPRSLADYLVRLLGGPMGPRLPTDLFAAPATAATAAHLPGD